MNARNNYLMNTLVLVSPDTDTARKSGIGYLDLRFPVRARLPTILNRHRFALSLLFSFSPGPSFSLLSTFFPSSLLSSLSLSLSLSLVYSLLEKTEKVSFAMHLADSAGDWHINSVLSGILFSHNTIPGFNVLRGAIDVSSRGPTPSPRIRTSNARII